MAATDPRTTILNGISTNLAAITKDDGVAIATVLHLWRGGPEPLKYLFYDEDYDVVVSYGDPRSRSDRNIQDVPVHYLMSYPVSVTTVDKPLAGALVCTASMMQYKVTYALRAAVAAFAQSAVGVSPAYTLKITSDDAVMKRVGGLTIYETKHTLEYETDYA